MSKQDKTSNNDLKRTGQPDVSPDRRDPARDEVTSPDTSAPLGYIKNRPAKDGLDKDDRKVYEKAKGDSVGNEVEKDL
ncbi:hypothetical protein BKP56_09005 [Marinilactibacillus sp. 15R]|uniref:hypothetical protein n=1 Tax=Marinilactibacillus sp. 15R TaxID=1911586 RepID=UPI00090B84AE|nr:hypothetical protein [Marinilactibacillus sp. 15R]API89385.1 hypothetical protein BKP56_09005 [Marinilactibacillus sp. 15R]